jgi:hypothetical protein
LNSIRYVLVLFLQFNIVIQPRQAEEKEKKLFFFHSSRLISIALELFVSEGGELKLAGLGGKEGIKDGREEKKPGASSELVHSSERRT